MKVAVVTGSNKGIGYAIARALCKKFDGDVFLTARDEARGKDAVESLKAEGLNPKFHQLDIEDKVSIERLKNFLVNEYGGLDVLINNAGFAYKGSSTVPIVEQAEVSMKINAFATLNVCRMLYPILRPHARVVNMSSRESRLSDLNNKAVKEQLLSPNLNEQDVINIANQFLQDVKDEKQKENGWKMSNYGMSKAILSALSIVLARELHRDPREDIILNFCCPGYVATDMSSGEGAKTTDEGADTPVYLALLPPNTKSPVGEFVAERKIINWNTDWKVEKGAYVQK